MIPVTLISLLSLFDRSFRVLLLFPFGMRLFSTLFALKTSIDRKEPGREGGRIEERLEREGGRVEKGDCLENKLARAESKVMRKDLRVHGKDNWCAGAKLRFRGREKPVKRA